MRMAIGEDILVTGAGGSSCTAGDEHVAGGLVLNADASMKGGGLGLGGSAHQSHQLRSGVRETDNVECALHAADLVAIRKRWWVGKGCCWVLL